MIEESEIAKQERKERELKEWEEAKQYSLGEATKHIEDLRKTDNDYYLRLIDRAKNIIIAPDPTWVKSESERHQLRGLQTTPALFLLDTVHRVINKYREQHEGSISSNELFTRVEEKFDSARDEGLTNKGHYL